MNRKSGQKAIFIPICFFFILFTGIILNSATKGQDSTQENQEQKIEPLHEYVEVINVEVFLRALKKGKPIGGLSASDFTLYEDGKPLDITSFLEIRRKIGMTNAETAQTQIDNAANTTTYEEKKEGESIKKRFFLLYFWQYEPDQQTSAALDFFFHSVYRDRDYVLMVIGDRVFKINRRQQVDTVLAQFNAHLEKCVRMEKIEREREVSELELMFKEFMKEFRLNEEKEKPQDKLIAQVIVQYKAAWRSYKEKKVTLGSHSLKQIAASLKQVNMEKWGIVFYQMETFPQLNLDTIYAERKETEDYLNELRREFIELGREMRSSNRSNAFMKEIQQAFIDSDTTFHLLLSTAKTTGQMEQDHVTLRHINSDWELAFTGIAQATGGQKIDDNNLAESLQQVAKNDDIYYRLTYTPAKNDKKERNIDIKSKDKGLNLQFHRKITITPPSRITIEQVAFHHPTLQFTIKNYRQFFDGDGLSGDINYKISRVDNTGELVTFEKDLEPDQEEISISLDMVIPKGGLYTLILEALDRQTGLSAIYSQKIEVPSTLAEAEDSLAPENTTTITGNKDEKKDEKNFLATLLQKSAAYCEKLKKVSFYFFCTEEVIDSYWRQGTQVKDEHYLYDYQILMEEDGKMTETRKPQPLPDDSGGNIIAKIIKDSREKNDKHHDDTNIVTSFYSNYPILLPITMLAQENQEKYHYQLLGQESQPDGMLIKVKVDPVQKKSQSTNQGILWIDSQDGSVVKIELHPQSIKGLDAFKKRARRKGCRLKVTNIHRYDVKREGICFPSLTEITGLFLPLQLPSHVSKKTANEEQVRTVFAYREYRFFNVHVEVTPQ